MAVTFPIPLLAEDFCEALIKAGVIAPGCSYKRVTITAEPRSIVQMTVELEGDERLLTLVPTLAGEVNDHCS